MTTSREFERGIFLETSQLLAIDFSNTNEVIAGGQRLEKLVNEAVKEGKGELLASYFTLEQRAQLRNLHSFYEVVVDDRFMDDIVSGIATTPDQYPFQSTYDRLSAMESGVMGIDESKSVIHIGTGWPGTAIGLYRQFGTPVTCVEKDPNVAKKSKDALEKLGLVGENKLQVVNADGTTINPENYGSIIISAMVPNTEKRIILHNLRQLATGFFDPLVILRNPVDKARSLFYQELDPEVFLAAHQVERVADTKSLTNLNDPLISSIYKIKPMARVLAGIEESHIINARRTLQPV